MEEKLIDNDNWECDEPRESDGDIVCKDKREYSDRTIKLEGGRAAAASITAKTDRGDDIQATSFKDQITFNANRVQNITDKEKMVRGSLE